jgi:hypothetical protein
MQQKRRRRKKNERKRRTMLERDESMDKCTDGEDLHLFADTHSQEKGKEEEKKKGEEQKACQNDKQ